MISFQTQRLGRIVGTNLRLGIEWQALRRILFILIIALGAGGLTAYLGLLTVPIAGGIILLFLLFAYGFQLWWKLLMFLMLGLLFFSKGFATLGYFPIYITEVTIGIGFLTLLLSPFISKIKLNFRPFLHWEIGVLLLFLIWQVLQTIPYFKYYQLDTIRDGMLYGYAALALLIMLMTPRKYVVKFFELFGQLIPFMLIWFPIFYIATRMNLVPLVLPGAPNPLLFTKGSDLGVHVAGAGAYMLLNLNRKNSPSWLSWLTWILWSFNILVLGAMGRGMMVAAAATGALVVLFRPLQSHWYRPFVLGVLVLCILLITGQYATLKLDIGIHREVSAEQLVANIVSIFGEGDNSEGGLEGTKQWRLHWWDEIIRYTFHGPYFWTGKGYGINLADSDGFQVDAETSLLRSPHNGHLTILARSGVPGFALWVIFLGGVALRLTLIATQYDQDPVKARYAVWLLAYLVAFGIIAAVDVFIEGPMGGVWFWALIGLTYVYFTPEKPAPTESKLLRPPLVGSSGAKIQRNR